ncbi:MAG: hypothetical protein HYX77_08565 [Acidobacteria bacterium]|nr:hypothetical protein [Acidobacteriota bacterium]
MAMLSEDDLNLREMSDAELERAWDLWFELAQATDEWDPPYEHGVFVGIEKKSSSTFADLKPQAGLVPATGGKKKM